MITFPQLLNLLTVGYQHSWFYLPSEYITAFTSEERALWYEELTNDGLMYRLYYPKDRVLIGLDKQGLQRMMLQAAEKGDMEMVRAIKERMLCNDLR